jgi:two-component system cell cycle response regulator
MDSNDIGGGPDRRGGAGRPVCLVVGNQDVVEPLVNVAVGLGWRIAVADPSDAMDIASTLRPDLVALDGTNADVDLLGELLEHPRLQWVPVVVSDRGDPAPWFSAGAREVLSDGMPISELEGRLLALMAHRSQVVALVRRNRELDDLAGIDVLTDLPNRRRLDEQLRALEGLATRRREPLGIVVVDIDHFKAVNDTYGHQAGDEVLRQVASRFRHALRTEDALGRWSDPTLGRWAGDEFIVGFAGADAPAIEQVAERLRVLVAAEPFLVDGGEPLEVTISIGGAVAVGEVWPELFRRADLALYKVKQSYRNATSVVTIDSHQRGATPTKVGETSST